VGTFKKNPAWIHWVKWGQIVSEPTMNSQWTCQVSNPLPPVYEMFLVGILQVHSSITFRMCMKCSCWEHVRQNGPVLAMFLTCSYLFPGTLTPSGFRSPSRCSLVSFSSPPLSYLVTLCFPPLHSHTSSCFVYNLLHPQPSSSVHVFILSRPHCDLPRFLGFEPLAPRCLLRHSCWSPIFPHSP